MFPHPARAQLHRCQCTDAQRQERQRILRLGTCAFACEELFVAAQFSDTSHTLTQKCPQCLSYSAQAQRHRRQRTAAQRQERQRRVMREARTLLLQPHPAFDIFPCENDMFFWRLIMEGPDGTPYAVGRFLDFSVDYQMFWHHDIVA